MRKLENQVTLWMLLLAGIFVALSFNTKAGTLTGPYERAEGHNMYSQDEAHYQHYVHRWEQWWQKQEDAIEAWYQKDHNDVCLADVYHDWIAQGGQGIPNGTTSEGFINWCTALGYAQWYQNWWTLQNDMDTYRDLMIEAWEYYEENIVQL